MTPQPPLIVIGGSLGATDGLKILLGNLPNTFPAAIGIVIHQLPRDHDSLAPLLRAHSTMPITVAEDKSPLTPGLVTIAPPNYHLLVDIDGYALSIDARVSNARPSADVLLESAALMHPGPALGVILSGGGKDGAKGAKRLETQGGQIIVEDPKSARAPSMPQATITACNAPWVLPLDAIAPALCQWMNHMEISP